ncbi:DNA alkylation repair protein [Paenibacillus oryzae]|nr:DNA alkylation repair protein [Paenibacillus oryzae]
MMNESINSLVKVYESHRDPQTAKSMAAYMKNQFPFLGIKTPLRREILKDFMVTNPPNKDWVPLLWNLPEREYLCVAIDILSKIKKTLEANDIILIENCIVTKPWWDTVDGLATNIVGYLFKKYPSLQEQYSIKWNHSDNIWLNRTAILFQLHYKQETNETLLYNFILNHASSSEFFIQKAIGWALREYSKTNSASVVEFIHNHDLKPLSKREGLRWLNKRTIN